MWANMQTTELTVLRMLILLGEKVTCVNPVMVRKRWNHTVNLGRWYESILLMA
jgi:hypothetical protein